ncbi:MAG: flagellar hook-basal body complex protein FliE [Candidatus Margulisiibacteriota bacterium]|nr:flagellar hook-basal body complex protein FliE [Candidatus Margulisiibacteriota bacterium]
MVQPIDPGIRLAQILQEDFVESTEKQGVVQNTPANSSDDLFLSRSPFVDILDKAIQSLEGVSRQEAYANQLIEQYVAGEADLQKVMVETSKANLMVQMTVTVVNNAVQTFKEITSMQI